MEIELGDISTPGTEAIINAANGCGIMGAGVAGAIRKSGGVEIEEAAKLLKQVNGKPFEPGECYVTTSGNLKRRGVKTIYHAVVMKYPGGFTSSDIVSKALRKALDKAIGDRIHSIAVPGLGTGIGKLDKQIIAGVMYKIILEVDPFIDVVIMDKNVDFINEMKSLYMR